MIPPHLLVLSQIVGSVSDIPKRAKEAALWHLREHLCEVTFGRESVANCFAKQIRNWTCPACERPCDPSERLDGFCSDCGELKDDDDWVARHGAGPHSSDPEGY